MFKDRGSSLTVIFILSLCISVLGFTSVAQADIVWGPVGFTDTGPGAAESGQYDQSGWVTVFADNQSSIAWGDFHFEVFSVGGSDISNVKFVVGEHTNGTTFNADPQSSQSPLSWSLSDNDQKIDLFYYSDSYAAGATGGWWKVHIDNPDQVLHGVSYYPTIVPEPISSTLFLIGGAALGFRRMRKIKN